MQLYVSPGDELPIYRQIMRQFTDAIAGGRLRPGERLPSHRELAEQLVIAPLTVKKACTTSWSAKVSSSCTTAEAPSSGTPCPHPTSRAAASVALSSLVILFARESIAAAYTSDLAVRELAVWLLLFVAAFQVPDGLQVGAAGALRGFKDAHVPMGLNFAAYWLIGFPAAWWFGIRQAHGPSGIWAGLIVGLMTCAAFLLLRYRQVTRQRMASGA